MNFKNSLIRWYSENKRDLPWRNTKEPYRIWLSEIILQQTQVKQGLPYYEAFIKTFPTVFDLSAADESEVLKLWQGLGYYSRARNLHTTAKYISNQLNGVFPNTYKDLLKLKGVGDYTSSAIASICFNLPHAVVDGNVYRVLARYYNIDTPINSTKGIKEFKALASSLIDSKNPGDYNQAIMEFGARQCKPKNPDCSVCPLNASCLALAKNKIDVLPIKLKKTKIKRRYFNYIVLVDGKKNILFEKRTKKGIWQNLYQFPLLETECEIDHIGIEKHQMLKQLLKREHKVLKFNDSPWVHKLSHQHLYTTYWILETEEIKPEAISVEMLKTKPTSALIAKFIDLFFEE